MATPTTLPAAFTAAQVLTSAEMNDLRGAFRVLQIVQTVKTNTFSGTSGTDGAPIVVTTFEATITPSSTSSKILVMASVSANGGGTQFLLLRRGGSVITAATGDAAGSAKRVTASGGGSVPESISVNYLDSPATTSPVTYDFTMGNNGTGFGVSVNVPTGGTAAADGRPISTITLFEVSA